MLELFLFCQIVLCSVSCLAMYIKTALEYDALLAVVNMCHPLLHRLKKTWPTQPRNAIIATSTLPSSVFLVAWWRKRLWTFISGHQHIKCVTCICMRWLCHSGHVKLQSSVCMYVAIIWVCLPIVLHDRSHSRPPPHPHCKNLPSVALSRCGKYS